MLTYEDCVAMSDLTEEEIEAIAEHERCHEMMALQMGNCLVQTTDGQHSIRTRQPRYRLQLRDIP